MHILDRQPKPSDPSSGGRSTRKRRLPVDDLPRQYPGQIRRVAAAPRIEFALAQRDPMSRDQRIGRRSLDRFRVATKALCRLRLARQWHPSLPQLWVVQLHHRFRSPITRGLLLYPRDLCELGHPLRLTRRMSIIPRRLRLRSWTLLTSSPLGGPVMYMIHQWPDTPTICPH